MPKTDTKEPIEEIIHEELPSHKQIELIEIEQENNNLKIIFIICSAIVVITLLLVILIFSGKTLINSEEILPVETPIATATPIPTTPPVTHPADNNLYKSLTVLDGERIAYLTFDDGPSPNVTPLVLDILKKEGVQGTFFVTGENVAKYPALVKRMILEGNVVGNHSFTHIYSSFYSDLESFENEINKTQKVLEESIGKEHALKLFRFPGGSYGSKMEPFRQKIIEMGINYVDWNCLTWSKDSGDNANENAENTIKATANEHEDLIILMHDAPAKMVTAETLPAIIRTLKDLSFKFAVIR